MSTSTATPTVVIELCQNLADESEIVSVAGEIYTSFSDEDFSGRVGLIIFLQRVALTKPLLAERCQEHIDRIAWEIYEQIDFNCTGANCAALDFFTDLRIVERWPFIGLTPDAVLASLKEKTPITLLSLDGIARLGRYLGGLVKIGANAVESQTIFDNELQKHFAIEEGFRLASASPVAIFRYLHAQMRRLKTPPRFIQAILIRLEIALNICGDAYVSKIMSELQSECAT